MKMTDADMKRMFYSAMGMVLVSKGLAIASPWFLKGVIDSMTVTSQLSFGSACLGIAAFTGSRFGAELTNNVRMYMVMNLITTGVRKLSMDSFTHLHSLDMNFHKTSSKNTVFAINRALRSVETGLRFVLSFFTPIAMEFTMLCAVLGFYCGPQYLANMLITLGFYTYYSKVVSEGRRVEMREKKNSEKDSEFYLNESIMNYETVKAFNNEKMENSRYKGLIDRLKNNSMMVQMSLSKLNVGQSVIFLTGLTLNLAMAANEVVNGTMTPGDFVMLAAYF